MALLISAVSAGTQGAHGTPSIANAARGAFASAIDSLRFGNALRISANLSARSITLDLTQNVLSPRATAVRFTFGGNQLQSATGAGAQDVFGTATVENGAQGIFANGIAPSSPFTVPIVFGAQFGQPRHDITKPRLAYPGLNVPFAFGGPLLVNAVGVGLQVTFGTIEKIKQPFTARPSGIAPREVALPIITDASRNGSYVPFDLSRLSGSNSLSIRFDFGSGAKPITEISAGTTSALGLSVIANTAQGASAPGVELLRFGFARVFKPAVRDGAVNIELAQGYTPQNPLNVPFYFNDAIGFGPTGYSAALFGGATIYNIAQGAFAQGISPVGFGTAHVQIPRFVRSSGIASGTAGSAVVTRPAFREIRPTGIVLASFGTHSIRLRYRTIACTGLTSGAFSGAYQVSWRKFVTPSGYLAVRFGAQSVELQDRALLATGSNMARYGAPSATHRVRTLTGPGNIASQAFGTPRITLRVRYVAPFGYTVASYGQSARIYNFDPTQLVQVPNLYGLVWGQTVVDQKVKKLSAVGIPSGEDFGNFNSVENRNKTIATFGTSFGKQGHPSVEELGQSHTLRPASILPGGFGAGSLRLSIRYLLPPGLYATAFSNFNAVAQNEAGIIRPGGIARPEVQLGAPLVTLGRFLVAPAGYVTLHLGSPTITFRQRAIASLGIYGTSFGSPRLERDLRFVTVPTLGAERFGSTDISLRKRLVTTVGSITVRFGTPVMGFDLTLAVPGIEAPLFGHANLHDNSQVIDLRFMGIAGAFGFGKLGLHTRRLQQLVTVDQAHVSSVAKVYNLRQTIAPYTDTSQTWGPYFGHFLDVANRNRTMRPVGLSASKVPIGGIVVNDARVVAPGGALTFSAGSRTFVAYGVRHLLPPGVDPGLSLRWHIVYNNARVLSTRGGDARLFGLARVENRNRTLKHHTGYVGAEWGLPYIDFALRALSFFSGIPPLPFGFASIENSAQFIRPRGFKWPDETGGHDVLGHRNVIGPTRMALQSRHGEAWVRNKTPQLYAYGHDSQLHGATKVRLQFRFLDASGISTGLWGKPLVRDRRTWTYVPGTLSLRIGLQRVSLAQPDLPRPQTIEAEGFPPFNDSTFRALIGTPNVYANSIYPEGVRVDRYGTPEIYLQGIRPESILPAANFAEQFGIPLVNPWFLIEPNGIAPIMPSRTDSGTNWGNGPNKHRIDPLTIWCRFDASDQALANHNHREWEWIDSRFANGSNNSRPFFGISRVENSKRELTQIDSSSFGRYGTPRLDLRRRSVQPVGYRAFKYGIAELFGGSRSFPFYGDVMGGIGSPAIAHYIPPFTTQLIRPSGFLCYATGANRIELKNRSLSPMGIAPLAVPRPTEVSRSPRYLSPSHYDAARFGTAWASLYTRTLETIGEDTAQVSYAIGGFALRMRVRHRDHYSIGGGRFGSLGMPRITSSIQNIQRVGKICHGVVTSCALSARNILALGGLGFDSSVFGDIDRWDAGTVKAHGDETLRYGLPRTQRRITTLGNAGQAGVPRTRRSIVPIGSDASDFGISATPQLSPHGCGQTARVLIPWAFVPSNFGSPRIM